MKALATIRLKKQVVHIVPKVDHYQYRTQLGLMLGVMHLDPFQMDRKGSLAGLEFNDHDINMVWCA